MPFMPSGTLGAWPRGRRSPRRLSMRGATAMKLVLAVALTASSAALAGDPEAGARVFKKCQACHAVGEGAVNRVGPVLNGLFGRPAGTYPDYKYSEANRTSGIVWSEEVFAEYIRNPRAYVPGTSMAFAGLKKDEEIEDIIAFLGRFNADGTLRE
jgi:cytochrome c